MKLAEVMAMDMLAEEFCEDWMEDHGHLCY